MKFYHQASISRKKRIDWLFETIKFHITREKEPVNQNQVVKSAMIELGLTRYKILEYLNILIDTDRVERVGNNLNVVGLLDAKGKPKK